MFFHPILHSSSSHPLNLFSLNPSVFNTVFLLRCLFLPLYYNLYSFLHSSTDDTVFIYLFLIPVFFFLFSLIYLLFTRCISSSTSSFSLSLNLLSPFLCKTFCFLPHFSYFLFLSTCLFLSLENLSLSLLIK